jgi:hypothetical protein
MAKTKGTWRAITAAGLLATALFGSGCAQDVGDIDRSQPNKVKKELFLQDDEWYFRQTISDTDWQGSVIFEGYFSDLKRVRWVVTENTLFACSSVPPVQGDYVVERIGDKDCYGIVAAFPIQGHFDLQRQYNTATGEESNVIVENSFDRPWFEREYMRVDWSRNMVDGFGMFGGIVGRFSSEGYTIPMDDNYIDPDRTRINAEEGYIEATGNYTFEPDLYACYGAFGYDGIWHCEGGRARVKNSFVRIAKGKTFEPMEYTDAVNLTDASGAEIRTTTVLDNGLSNFVEVRCTPEVARALREQSGELADNLNCRPKGFDLFTRFGYFRTENIIYDEGRGGTDEGRLYRANHWNIWRTAYDEDGNLIPMKDRQPKPIVYYTNSEYRRDALPGAAEVERQWDEVFKETVRLAKGYDTIKQVEDELLELYGSPKMYQIRENGCLPSQIMAWHKRTGNKSVDRKNVEGIINMWAEKGTGATTEDRLWSLPATDRNLLCAELEWSTEPRGKGTRFEWQRSGDVRYSFFSWVEEFNIGWLGYGPSSADPVTGEIISAAAHFAGSSLAGITQYYADIVQYMNGELTLDQIQTGDHIRRYIKTVRDESKKRMQQALTPEGKREFVKREGLNPDRVSTNNFRGVADLRNLPEFLLKRGVRGVKDEANRISEAAEIAKRQDTRVADFFKRPEVKQLLMANPDTLAVAKAFAKSRNPGGEITDANLEEAYLLLNAPHLEMYRNKKRSQLLASQNIYTVESAMRAVEGLITFEGLAEGFRGKSRKEIEDYVFKNVFVSTQLHEVGHTLGLRHNFNASMDALNYTDAFWRIEEAIANGELTRDEAARVTKKSVLDRIAPGKPYVSSAEQRVGSIMDYTAEMTADFGGLGKYDKAAIHFVYGKKVQRWKPEVLAQLPDGLSFRLFLTNYLDLPELFSGMDSSADPKARRLKGIDNILNGREWVDIDTAKKDIVDGIQANTDKWIAKSFQPGMRAFEASTMTVPYNFCTDDREDFELGCNVFDWGATQREIINNAFDRYRFYQPWWRNKRQGVNRGYENLNSYINRVFQAFNTAERPFRFYSIYRYWDLGSYTDDLREAAIDAINFYAEVLATPEPGRYCLYDQNNYRGDRNWQFEVQNTYVPARNDVRGGNCPEFVDIAPGQGAYFGFDFTDEYEFRVNYVGSYFDKLIAISAFFNVSANFLYNTFITDSRATNINYWTLFKDDTLGMLRSLILNDYTSFGGLYDVRTAGYAKPVIVDRDAFTYGVPKQNIGKPRIFSRLTFDHQFNAIVYGILVNSNFEDRAVDFAQYIKVAVDNNETQDWAGAQISEFVHPISFQRYLAPQTADGKSISVELIGRANSLAELWKDAVANRDQAKAVYDRLRLGAGASFNPRLCGPLPEDLTGVNVDPNSTAQDNVCNAMFQFEQARTVAQLREDQMGEIVAKLDQIRFVWQALGPNALR